VKPHAIFLRAGCLLPVGLNLTQEQFCAGWMSVEDTTAAVLDRKVRSVGWHFMWLVDSYCRFGVGRKATSAVGRAIMRALSQVKGASNGAEVDSVNVSDYLGFRIAKVTLSARQIQLETSLG
jgi:hypothetical protein